MNRYLNLGNYVTFFLHRLAELISFFLQPLERYLAEQYGDEGIRSFPPVFIVGAPRSGSTLLYKLLTERYCFAFLSNFSAGFYKTPICASWLAIRLGIQPPKGNYDFRYGRVKGLGSPSEGGAFWYRWFPKGLDVYVGPNVAGKRHLEALRHSIGAISLFHNRPMVFKNLYNSMRIAPIVEAIPEASFIVCKRDYVNMALSILKCRMMNFKSKRHWWSVPPREIQDLLQRTYAEQVAGQVYHIYEQMEKDRKDFDPDRFLEIGYEDLCQDVHGVLPGIEDFLRRRGCRPARGGDVPPAFDMRDIEGIDSHDREGVEEAVRSFFSKD